MSPPRRFDTIAWPLVQALKPQPRTEQDMTESDLEQLHRINPDAYHRHTLIDAEVCLLCDREAAGPGEAK